MLYPISATALCARGWGGLAHAPLSLALPFHLPLGLALVLSLTKPWFKGSLRYVRSILPEVRLARLNEFLKNSGRASGRGDIPWAFLREVIKHWAHLSKYRNPWGRGSKRVEKFLTFLRYARGISFLPEVRGLEYLTNH